MSRYIYEDDITAKIALLEGLAWQSEQGENLLSPFHVPVWLNAWKTKQARGEADKETSLSSYTSEECLRAVSPIVYGKGGFHRYVVEGSGEILFSQAHSTPSATAYAQSLGFNLS